MNLSEHFETTERGNPPASLNPCNTELRIPVPKQLIFTSKEALGNPFSEIPLDSPGLFCLLPSHTHLDIWAFPQSYPCAINIKTVPSPPHTTRLIFSPPQWLLSLFEFSLNIMHVIFSIITLNVTPQITGTTAVPVSSAIWNCLICGCS